MVYNTKQLNIYCLFVYFGKRGGVGEVRVKVEGQQFTGGVENTNKKAPVYNLY
jgi:hypothetical protein